MRRLTCTISSYLFLFLITRIECHTRGKAVNNIGDISNTKHNPENWHSGGYITDERGKVHWHRQPSGTGHWIPGRPKGGTWQKPCEPLVINLIHAEQRDQDISASTGQVNWHLNSSIPGDTISHKPCEPLVINLIKPNTSIPEISAPSDQGGHKLCEPLVINLIKPETGTQNISDPSDQVCEPLLINLVNPEEGSHNTTASNDQQKHNPCEPLVINLIKSDEYNRDKTEPGDQDKNPLHLWKPESGKSPKSVPDQINKDSTSYKPCEPLVINLIKSEEYNRDKIKPSDQDNKPWHPWKPKGGKGPKSVPGKKIKDSTSYKPCEPLVINLIHPEEGGQHMSGSNDHAKGHLNSSKPGDTIWHKPCEPLVINLIKPKASSQKTSASSDQGIHKPCEPLVINLIKPKDNNKKTSASSDQSGHKPCEPLVINLVKTEDSSQEISEPSDQGGHKLCEPLVINLVKPEDSNEDLTTPSDQANRHGQGKGHLSTSRRKNRCGLKGARQHQRNPNREFRRRNDY